MWQGETGDIFYRYPTLGNLGLDYFHHEIAWEKSSEVEENLNLTLTLIFDIYSSDPDRMADVLIRSFSKILSLLVGPTNVAIDNWTFQMFYKVTPMLLGACVILVCTRNIVLEDRIKLKTLKAYECHWNTQRKSSQWYMRELQF